MIALRSAAKLNLTLDITGRRPDGYHEIRSVVQTVSLWDELTLSPTADRLTFVCTRPDLESPDNLCVRAAKLLAAAAHRPCRAHLELEKRIPVGAGLGGGSGNAAATLLGLNELWRLNWSREQLARLALELGADVPYFLHGGLVLMEGIGERLTPLTTPVNCHFVILQGRHPMSTAAAYRRFDRHSPQPAVAHGLVLELLRQGRLDKAAALFQNVLEKPVAVVCPDVVRLKRLLVEQQALAAVMSGSGSAVFGVFPTVAAADAAKEVADRQSDVVFAFTAQPTAQGVCVTASETGVRSHLAVYSTQDTPIP